jgi:DNA-binding transcriptional regulator YiaG
LAEALRLGANGARTVRRWEAGDIAVTGPAAVAIELMLRDSGSRPEGENAEGG